MAPGSFNPPLYRHHLAVMAAKVPNLTDHCHPYTDLQSPKRVLAESSGQEWKLERGCGCVNLWGLRERSLNAMASLSAENHRYPGRGRRRN
jgi:hypothetical protein